MTTEQIKIKKQETFYFEEWIKSQDIMLSVCTKKEKGFLKRIFFNIRNNKELTQKQKDTLEDCKERRTLIIKDKDNNIVKFGDNRFKDLMSDFLEIREPFAKIPPKKPEEEGEYLWYPYKRNSKGEQSWYFTDKEGNWYITLKQNAIATESNYKSDRDLWGNSETGLKHRKYETDNRLMFEEGKMKDYFYMKRTELPLIFSMPVEPALGEKPQKRHTGGKEILIFTYSGTLKFNFRKKKEASIRVADALVERDRDFIREERKKLGEQQENLKEQLIKLGEIKEIKQLINLDYKNTLKEIPIKPDQRYVDIEGNILESKGEVNSSNIMILIKWLTGVSLDAYHPEIIKFTDQERIDFQKLISIESLRKAGWEGNKFPYQLTPDFGFKKLPNIIVDFFGKDDPQYRERRRIKELIYKLKGYKLISIEKTEDSNYPYLAEKIIKALHLRKRKDFKGKL